MLIIGFAYYQYKANIRLQAENYNLQATVVETQARLDTVIKQAEEIGVINNTLVLRERELHQTLFDLSHKFTKGGRNFENLSRMKPGLMAQSSFQDSFLQSG